MTGETKALWFFAFLVVSGAGVRLWKARTPPPPEPVVQGIERQIARVDSAREARSVGKSRGRRGSRSGRQRVPPVDSVPDGPPQLVDVDRATPEELDRLPGIGPALAARILADRETAGAFGGMDALCGVRGIGPALAGRLRPLVTFSGPPRLVSAACDGGSRTAEKGRGARSRKPS